MIKPYRLVVFDWEGTLGDTLGQIFHTVAMEARRLGFGEINEELARQAVDLGLVKALKKIFPHLNEEEQESLVGAVQNSLISKTTEIFLIPGAKEFVEKLVNRGIEVAIATNKGQQSLNRALILSRLDVFFKTTRSAGQTPAKPCPQMLEEILDECQVSSQDALMIGDSVTDIEMAKSIGVDAIGLDFYHQQRAALTAAGALKVFDDYDNLSLYLQLP